ncbi:hypothetical protein Dimus_009619 [Dionaea muscipula]
MAVEAALIPIHQTHVLRRTGCEPLSSFVVSDSCASKSAKQGKFQVLPDSSFQDGSIPLNLPVSGDSKDDSGSITPSSPDNHMIEAADSVKKEKPARKAFRKKNGKKNHATARKSIQGLLVETGQQCGCQGNKVSGASQQSDKDNPTGLMKNSRTTSAVFISSCEVRSTQSASSTSVETVGVDIKMCVSDAAKRAGRYVKENRQLKWHKCRRGADHAELHIQNSGVQDDLNVDATMLEKEFSPRQNNSSNSTVDSLATFSQDKARYEGETYSLPLELNLASSSCRRNREYNRKRDEQSRRTNLNGLQGTKISWKWVPVCKKDMKIPETTTSVGEYINWGSVPELPTEECNRLGSSTIAQALIASSRASVNDSSISPSRTASGTQDDRKVNDIKSEIIHTQMARHFCSGPSSIILSESLSQFINSLTAEKAFGASCRLQIASENVEQAKGYPLAEFERLLQCATPVIASSFSCKACESCLQNQPHSPSTCRHPKPSISLHAVWNWYEEPGNYGMKVSVQDSRYHEAFGASQVSFDAHFVPFLSAVQLFGHQKLSPCRSYSDDVPVTEIQVNGEPAVQSSAFEALVITSSSKEFDSLISKAAFNLFKQPVDSSKASSQSHGRDAPGGSFPALFNDMELMFEFFESEQPHQRMPLYDKVLELASAGTCSDNHKSGDPSKLESANLRELHPASWFSVAWYPIYRIPEGKLRAAFLTYHSLGYLVHRCLATDVFDKNALCVLFPVIGLQSCNAQDELWFDPRMKADGSSFKELASGVLKERIKTLEENALLFARGLVRKDARPTGYSFASSSSKAGGNLVLEDRNRDSLPVSV